MLASSMYVYVSEEAIPHLFTQFGYHKCTVSATGDIYGTVLAIRRNHINKTNAPETLIFFHRERLSVGSGIR